jgi:integrase
VYNALNRLCEATGVVWKANALRHSFVTYMLQITRDPSGLAEQCGHSMYVASANYKALSDPETAAEWFAIEPTEQEQP